MMKEHTSVDEVMKDIKDEISRAREWIDNDLGSYKVLDTANTKNDWVAYVTAYAGHGADAKTNCGEDFEDAMMKAAGLCVSAIIAHRNGWC